MQATDDVDEILALGADCVHYAPLHADVDELCRILRAGTNVVTPVGFVYPTPDSAADFEALRAACADGGSSFHGTGVHPGFSGDLLPLIFARVMTRLDQVQVREVADFRLHPSKAMQDALGFGRDPVDAVANPGPLVKTMDRIFEQSMTMVVEALGRTVERFTVEFDVAEGHTRPRPACRPHPRRDGRRHAVRLDGMGRRAAARRLPDVLEDGRRPRSGLGLRLDQVQPRPGGRPVHRDALRVGTQASGRRRGILGSGVDSHERHQHHPRRCAMQPPGC